MARTLATLRRWDLAGREAAAVRVLERPGASALGKRARKVLDSLTDKSRPDGPLTRRERQVVWLIARGMRDGNIANALSLSHVSNIYAKLGCSTRAAAVAKAAELEML